MRPLLAICGVADGLGRAQAGLFADAGYDVLGLARSDRAAESVRSDVEAAGGRYAHEVCDLGRAEEARAALEPHRDRVEVVIHNAHLLQVAPFLETGADRFEAVWRAGCLSAVHVAEAVLPVMTARGSGAVLFTGATAGLRGGARFAAFASAKFALRGLCQSLAREFGPQGVHVAHIAIDGLIAAPQTDARFGAAAEPGVRLSPCAVAQSYLQLVRQSPSAWTHELDLRPSVERF